MNTALRQHAVLRTDSTHNDFVLLVNELNKDLQLRYGAKQAFYDQFNKLDTIKNVVVVYLDETPVGCGAFRPYDETSVEIKRMFVSPAYRGRGMAQIILNELEKWTAESGYTICILETGDKQHEAIALYKKSGYHITENFGQYIGDENSICMRKEVS